jgi:transposase
MRKKNSLFAITHDGKKMTCGYYSTFRTALFNGLAPYEYLVYLYDSLPYREDKRFDYTSYLP